MNTNGAPVLRAGGAGLIGACVLLCALCAAADEYDQVWSRLAEQQQAQGRFLQEMYSEEGELLERSSGRYAVLRPDYFRWVIEYPDRQQILVRGDELWHYDEDLAAATRRSIAQQGEFTALELLAGAPRDLRERFAVEVIDEASFRLIPRFSQAGFAAVILSWDAGEIVGMEIRDRSDQLIRVTLTPDEEWTTLAPSDFELQLPDDVDVYDARQR